MSSYIYSSSAICTIDFSSKVDILKSLVRIEKNKSLHEPVYKEFVNPMLLRRMSKATKMSVVCALKCLKEIGDANPNAIIVGTGLGAIIDTEKFLTITSQIKSSMLPPTAFIQSGHNSIAGQIALLLKNDAYNMTHVQQGLSFEYALKDAMLTLQEGGELALVGAADEHSPLLQNLAEKLHLEEPVLNQLFTGAAFFALGSSAKNAKAKIKIVSICSFTAIKSSLVAELAKLGLSLNNLDIGFVGFNLADVTLEKLPFKLINYTNYTGRFLSSAAVGLHLATHYMQYADTYPKYAAVINVASKDKLGIIIIERV